MKKDIHPEYFEKAKISCACGQVYEIGSTSPTLEVEICAACHPFFTGKQKILDTARRVEKLQERQAKQATLATRGGKKARITKRVARKVAKKA